MFKTLMPMSFGIHRESWHVSSVKREELMYQLSQGSSYHKTNQAIILSFSPSYQTIMVFNCH